MVPAAVAKHDQIPYINEHGKTIRPEEREREEQILVAKYVRPHSCVLELGARYGMVPNVLSSILAIPTRHMAVEPDAQVLAALFVNRQQHGGVYHVCTSVVSDQVRHRELVDCDFPEGYAKRTVEQKTGNPKTPEVSNRSLYALEAEVGCAFDCLVADCEGCLGTFVDEYPWFLLQLHTIILEKDFPDLTDYDKLTRQFERAGLVCVLDGFRPVFIREPNDLFIDQRFSTTGWGCIGVAGFLGYEIPHLNHSPDQHRIVPIFFSDLLRPRQVSFISAHAPSLVRLRTPHHLYLHGRVLSTPHSMSPCVYPIEFHVDGQVVHELRGSASSTPNVLLSRGWHDLEIRTRGRKKKPRHAYTLWAFTVLSDGDGDV